MNAALHKRTLNQPPDEWQCVWRETNRLRSCVPPPGGRGALAGFTSLKFSPWFFAIRLNLHPATAGLRLASSVFLRTARQANEHGFSRPFGTYVLWLVTRQYNFIVWEVEKLEELSKALQNRIEATIGRGALISN